MISTVTFDRVAHVLRVPVQLADQTYRFLVDTGIGITVVSSTLADCPDVSPTGRSFAGRRMSGQVVEAPLVRLPALQVGEYRVADRVAGVADLGADFDGILSPGFFEPHAITIDPDRRTLAVDEPGATPDGVVVSLEVRRDGPSVAPFASLVLPSGRTVTVEIDTGTENLILGTRYLEDCGLSLGDPAIETKTGTDETGYDWTRHRATIGGTVHLAGAPQTAQAAPHVIFQDIIYDGLVGTDYLERYLITLDVAGERMILSAKT